MSRLPPDDGHGSSSLPTDEDYSIYVAAALESIARLAAQTVAADCAMVCFHDRKLRWLGCAHSASGAWPLEELDWAIRLASSEVSELIGDLHSESRFARTALANPAYGIRCYAGVPITGNDAQATGTLCVLDKRPESISPSQLRTLEELAALASSVVGGYLFRRGRPLESAKGRNQYGELFEKTPDIIYVHDLNGRITAVNRTGENLLGYSRRELLSKTITDVIDGKHAETVRQSLLEQCGGGIPKSHRLVFRTKSGQGKEFEVTGHLLFDLGKPVGLMSFARPAGGLRAGAEVGQPESFLSALHRLATRVYPSFRNLVTDYVDSGCRLLDVPVGMVTEVHGDHCRIRYSQAGGEVLRTRARIRLNETRFAAPVAGGKTRLYQVKRPRKRSPIYAPGAAGFLLCAPVFRASKLWGVLAFASRNPVENFDPRLIELVELLAKNLGQKLLETDANHRAGRSGTIEASPRERQLDNLTGLPNARSMKRDLEEAMSRVREAKGGLAAVLIGLDRFKQYNEALGPAVGDRLLKSVGERIRASLPEEHIFGRMDSDRFLVVIRDDDRDHVEGVVRSLLAVIRWPLFLEGLDLFLTASAGVGFFPRDANDSASLLWNAEAALSAAKRADRGGLVFFSPQTRAADFRILELENALRGALVRKEFRLHFQPQIERDGKLVGMEALLHWRHAKLGEVPARQFIPVAEETGLIVPIGAWVLHTACRQMASWRNQGAPEAKIAVNVSALQFARPDLADVVADALGDSGVNPSSLEMEITESAVMRDIDLSVATLTRLRDLGVGISIDDFGTGYSSLSYLRRLPADTLKIDRSFLDDGEPSAFTLLFIETIVGLAHSLGLSVVGEGVETLRQFELLRRAGCDRFQGHLFGSPVGSSKAGQILRSGRLQPNKNSST